MLLPLSLFDLPLRLQSDHPPLAPRTLHALSVFPFGCAEALPLLAIPTFCSHFPVFTSVSLRNSPTFNLSTWPVSSPTLTCPRRSTLSLPFVFNFGITTAGFLTAGSVFFVRSLTLHLAFPIHAAPPSRHHPPLHLAHPPRFLPPVLTCSLSPRLPQLFSSSRTQTPFRTVLLPGSHPTSSCTSLHFLSHSRLLRSRTVSPVAYAVGSTATAPSRSPP